MPNLSVLLTRVTIPFATFVLIATLEHSTGPAASLALTNGFVFRGDLVVVLETRLAPKMSITLGAGDSDGGECERRPNHIIATRLFSDVCGII